MNIIIVHGSYGKPFENWFPWIENELSKQGITCIIPTFPTPLNQNYFTWEKIMDCYLDCGYITKDTILIGHSCGAAFITKYVALKNIQVKGIISISGYTNLFNDEHMDRLNESFYFDKNEVLNIRENVKYRYSFYSLNDPFIPLDKLKEFANFIDSKELVEAEGGHFNLSAGYNKFEGLFDLLKNIE